MADVHSATIWKAPAKAGAFLFSGPERRRSRPAAGAGAHAD